MMAMLFVFMKVERTRPSFPECVQLCEEICLWETIGDGIATRAVLCR